MDVGHCIMDVGHYGCGLLRPPLWMCGERKDMRGPGRPPCQPAEAAGPAADAVSVVGLHPRLAQPAGWAQALACVQAHPLKPMTGSPGGEVLGGASLSGDAPVVGVTAGGEPATGAAVVLGQEGLRERDYGGVGVGVGAGVEAG